MLDLIPTVAQQRTVAVVRVVEIARETFRLRLNDPELAGQIRPGQFVMIRPASGGPLLGRPFALYEVVRDPTGFPSAVDLVFQTVGEGTRALARLHPGDLVVRWGPLGNGFRAGPGPDQPVVFVAGGIGQTPFLSLARWWHSQANYGTPDPRGQSIPTAGPITLLYGIRSARYAAGVADFQAAGVAVELATDDGSTGHHGWVTDLLRRRLDRGERPARVVGCGPPAMLATLARIAEAHDLDCDVSLENHMACGFGACYSCVAPIHQSDGTTDLRRVCVEGPIFPSHAVAWPGSEADRALA